MKFSMPFSATRAEQFPLPNQYGQEAVEAIVFNRQEIEGDQWSLIWKNIEKATQLYGGQQVSFHFPINHCDFVTDPFVRDRLIEGLKRATDLDLRGIVVHSNQVEPDLWHDVDFQAKREKVLDSLLDIRSKVQGKTLIGLENMPLVDNDASRMDPLFVFPEDFEMLRGTDLKVVWDVCHFAKTLANVDEVLSGKQELRYYPNIKEAGELDFLSIRELIFHWHFSAFIGIANPKLGIHSVEGCQPWESTIGESLYKNSIEKILETASPEEHIVFEIQEKDYCARLEVQQTIKWAKARRTQK